MVSQEYDVWTLACVLLEVVAYLTCGGTQAVKKIDDERRQESSSGNYEYTFYKPSQVGDGFELNYSLKLHDDGPSRPDQKYIQELGKLFEKIFGISERISSR